MDAKPKRCWYQFSLRTMLVTMIVASAVFGYWVHWSKEWIRQRQQWLESPGELPSWYVNPLVPPMPGWPKKVAPNGQWLPTGLWLLDEEPVKKLHVSDV